jgi:hypothetical protein
MIGVASFLWTWRPRGQQIQQEQAERLAQPELNDD